LVEETIKHILQPRWCRWWWVWWYANWNAGNYGWWRRWRNIVY